MAKIRRENPSFGEEHRRVNTTHARRAYDYDADMSGRQRRPVSQSRPATQRRQAPQREPAARRVSTAAARRPRKQQKRKKILILQLIVSVLLAVQVWRTQMLPIWLFGTLCAVLLLLWIFLLRMQKYPKRGAFTRFCAWCLTGVMAVGCVFTQEGLNALALVTAGGNNTVIGVYVLTDDPAKKLADAKDYSFGCISEMDRDNTDKAIENISVKAEPAAAASGYDSMYSLVDGLYNGEVQAIILNQAFVSVIEDEENNYTDFSARTRCIYTYTISNENLLGNVTGAEAKKITQEPFLVYLSGVDTRGELSDTCRSDVNIIAAVNPQTKRVVLINTPRDFYVPLAGTDGAMDKLTHAGLYGVDCSMETLGSLYGIDIGYFVKIDFTGFIGIVDALGGIDVESDYAFTSVGSPGYYNPTTFTEGMNHMDGTSALAFARERHAFQSGDIQRGINQMKVISAVVDKIKSPAVLRGYSRLMNSVGDSFLTNLSHDQVAALVRMQLNDGADWTIESYSVTGSGAKSTQCYSARGSSLYVMQPDESTVATAQAMLASVLNGEAAVDTEAA